MAALAIVMLAWIGVRTAMWFVEHPVGTILPRAQAKLTGAPGPVIRSPVAVALPRAPQAPRTALVPAAAAFEKAPPTAGRAGRALAPAEEPRQLATISAPVRHETAGTERLLAAPGAPAGPWQLGPAEAAARRDEPGPGRWSGDAWLLVRGGGGTAAFGPAATYGASQAGAVLRYRLAPGNRHRPAAYLRASAALNGSDEREAALGVSARPLGWLPVVVAAEGRVTRVPGRTALRPAVLAYTELPPIPLPEAARAELYVQGGYVGGADATAFIDGQLRVDRRFAELGGLELRAGGGAWGGAQRGAARLDVGPSASLALAGKAGAARIAVDWRFRVAGAAEPASGPALTVSAGF